MSASVGPVEFLAYTNQRDEEPLLEFLRSTGGRLLRQYSTEWPPEEVVSPICRAEDECLAIWYPEVISEGEMATEDCRPEKEVYYNACELPVIGFQRQWYWKKNASIFSLHADHHTFRPGWPVERFEPHLIVDFEARLQPLIARFQAIRKWSQEHLHTMGPHCFIGEGALRDSDELRSAFEHRLAK